MNNVIGRLVRAIHRNDIWITRTSRVMTKLMMGIRISEGFMRLHKRDPEKTAAMLPTFRSPPFKSILRLIAGMAFLWLSIPTPAHAQDITTGLVGHWRLDETSGPFTDEAGGNSATEVNNTAAIAAQSSGGQLCENGNSAYITAPAQQDYRDLRAFTVSFWTRLDDYGGFSGWLEVIDLLQVRNNFGNGRIEFHADAWDTQGGSWRVASEHELPLGQWTHVAMTYDYNQPVGTPPVIYINGQEVTDYSTPFSPIGSVTPPADGTLHICAVNNSGIRELKGAIDDVRIYDRILSIDDVTELYRSWDGNITYDADTRVPKYFNGDDWVAMGESKYVPNAVEFDGTNDYMLRGGALTGVTDGKRITASFWSRFNTYPSATYAILDSNPSRARISYSGGGTETMQMIVRDSGGSVIANIGCGPNPHVADVWYHHLISIDVESGQTHCYVNGADSIQTFTAPTNVTLDFTSTEYSVGASTPGSSMLDGNIADLWIDFGTYIDLSIEANRRKFIDENGDPVHLGADGSLPTGSAPDIFLSGDTDSWHTNKGTGDGFTENGALTDAGSNPGKPFSIGYFVEGPLVDGNLGGISGANATCLSELQSGSWVGKTTADNNGQLVSGNVKAWLCTLSECQNLVPDSTYAYASISNSSEGGGTMTTTAEGYTEDDGRAYEDADAFGNTNGFRWFWTGRGTEDQTPYSSTCNDWTSNSGSVDSSATSSDITFYPEKLGTFLSDCDQSQRLICFVDPVNYCSNPARAEGSIIYNADSQAMQYCDGANWQAMGPVPGDGAGGCSNPTRAEGSLIFNKDHSVMQYCEGDEWVSVGSWTGPAPPSGPQNCPNIGDTCDDGSVYAGLSPDGNVAMYTTPADAASLYTWNDGTSNYTDMSMANCTDTSPGTAATCQTGEANTAFLVGATGEPDYPFAAAAYCDGLSAHGYSDWYLPAQDELNVLYTNKNTGDLNGTFNETGSYTAGYYWSSSENDSSYARNQRFSNGGQGYDGKDSGMSVRCVRK